MGNSKLVDVVIYSPNWNWRGNNKVKKITIHHSAGIASVESMGELFANKEREGSANYGIGNDGRVGLYVPENKRAWTSGSPENDYQAITIEVSNCEYGGEWAVSDEAYDKLILFHVVIYKLVLKLLHVNPCQQNIHYHE